MKPGVFPRVKFWLNFVHKDNFLRSDKNTFLCPTPNRLYSTSFVKTNAPGGFQPSGTAVLTDFFKKHPAHVSLCQGVILWCSLVEPTPYVPRRSPWQQFSPPHKNCHRFGLAGSGALRAPLPARGMPWQFLCGGRNCWQQGDCVGTQGSVQLANSTVWIQDRHVPLADQVHPRHHTNSTAN